MVEGEVGRWDFAGGILKAHALSLKNSTRSVLLTNTIVLSTNAMQCVGWLSIPSGEDQNVGLFYVASEAVSSQAVQCNQFSL